jgi:hypothetical protein
MDLATSYNFRTKRFSWINNYVACLFANTNDNFNQS